MYTRGNSGRWQVACHELKDSHLGRGVLHGHTVGLELEICISPNVLAVVGIGQQRFFRVVEMSIEDLLGQSQLPRAQNPSNIFESLEDLLVGRDCGLSSWVRLGRGVYGVGTTSSSSCYGGGSEVKRASHPCRRASLQQDRHDWTAHRQGWGDRCEDQHLKNIQLYVGPFFIGASDIGASWRKVGRG